MKSIRSRASIGKGWRGAGPVVTAALLCFALLLAACGDGDAGADASDTGGSDGDATDSTDGNGGEGSDEPITLGVVLSLSGPAAVFGIEERRGIEFAVDAVNESGGILGRQVELIFRDTGLDPARASTAVRELIEADVDAFIGPTVGGVMMPVVTPIVEEAGFPWITSAGSPASNDGLSDWVAKVVPANDIQGRALATYAARRLEAQGDGTVALIASNQPSMEFQSSAARDELENLGIEIVADEVFDGEAVDVTPELTGIRNADPDVILAFAQNPQTVTVLRNMGQLGMDSSSVVGVVSFADPGAIEPAGDAAIGITALTFINAADPTPAQQDLVERFQQTFAKPPAFTAIFGWDPIQVYKRAVEIAGTTDREAVAQAWTEIEGLQGAMGTLTYQPDTHEFLAPGELQFGVWNGETYEAP